MYYYYFRMLAQSYTSNLYTPPLNHNFFIILSPLFFATVSIPIYFEPRIHPLDIHAHTPAIHPRIPPLCGWIQQHTRDKQNKTDMKYSRELWNKQVWHRYTTFVIMLIIIIMKLFIKPSSLNSRHIFHHLIDWWMMIVYVMNIEKYKLRAINSQQCSSIIVCRTML